MIYLKSCHKQVFTFSFFLSFFRSFDMFYNFLAIFKIIKFLKSVTVWII